MALAGILAALGVFVGAQAPDLKLKDIDRDTAQKVARLLEHDHIAKPTLNNEISQKWARNYLKSLDPLKYYFLKADVDLFLAHDTQLDDDIKEGNIDFAKAVFERFLKRSDERLADAAEILTEAPDFSVDESMVDDPDRIDYPADAHEARERLRKLLKYELLRDKVSKLDVAAETKKLLIRQRDMNRFFKQFDSSEILERYLTSLATAIDPHSAYMNSKTLEDMLGQQLHLTLDGIGASLLVEDGYPVVKEIVPGGAADKDGRLDPEDRIVAIENEQGERDDFVNKKLSDVVRKIRGPRGTKVRLVVQPEGSQELKVYELTRQKIELNESRAKGKIIEAAAEKDASGKPLKIGIIHLAAFYGDTAAVMNGDPGAISATRDCRRLLEEFKSKGVDAVVVDLRSNGGGLLQEAITLSGLFIDKGPVVQVRASFGSTKHLDDDDEGTAWDGPLAVVIDHLSASASEIFAGVMRDYGRALIIGDTSTYGKGTVQSIVPISDRRAGFGGGDDDGVPRRGALKLTIQQFYRPNGDSTQIRGVASDVHIPSFRDQSDIGEGKSENALKFDKIPPLPHDMYNRVPPELVVRLQTRSDERRKSNPKFQEQEAAIKRYLDRKARHEISLSEAKFKSEIVSNDDQDDEDSPKPKKKRKRHTEQNAWETNFYNDEVVAIVKDYVRLGGDILIAAPVHPGAADREALMP
jgi:carboxyl-terminal processing protease